MVIICTYVYLKCSECSELLQVLRVVAPRRCLLPINFSAADIADPDVCASDLDLSLHHPLLIAAVPANQRVHLASLPKKR